MILTHVVAVDKKFGIGKDNNLLWHLPKDLKNFKELTSGGVVVMGRKTFESIGKPLPNRVNIILSRNQEYSVEGAKVFNSIPECVNFIKKNYADKDEIFIIGGASIYSQTLSYVSKIVLTMVEGEFDADRHYPNIESQKSWKLVSSEKFEVDSKNSYAFNVKTYELKGTNTHSSQFQILDFT